MPDVQVSGLPAEVKLGKLKPFLRAVLKKANISERSHFWIREMSDIPGTDLKEIVIEFEDLRDAGKARDFLDQFAYRHIDQFYILTANLANGRQRSPHRRHREREYYNHRSSERYGRRRSRSRSPLYREKSKLDLEIELLRKQREVIEEERRLLLQRKRLELIQEFGTNAVDEFGYSEDRGWQRPVNEDRYRRSRRRTPTPPRRRGPPPSPPKRTAPINRRSLPMFVLPCKLLINEMKPLIDAQALTKKDTQILIKLIRATLRKRIAVALEGKDYMNTAAIMKMYRKLYPVTLDTNLIEKELKIIQQSKVLGLKAQNEPEDEKEKDDSHDKGKGEDVTENDAMDLDMKNMDKIIDVGDIDIIEAMPNEAVSLDNSEAALSDKDWIESDLLYEDVDWNTEDKDTAV